MAGFIDKSTQWVVARETTYGVAPTINPTTHYVEAINPSMDASIEMVERETLKNSMVKAQALLGKETCSGSMEFEASSATSAGTINGDLLYESAMGHRIARVTATAGTVVAGTGANVGSAVIAFTTAANVNNYQVGQAVRLSGGNAGVPEFAVVRSITAGVSMVVAPAPAALNHTNFGGLLSFTIARPTAAQVSLTVQEYMEAAAKRVLYSYSGVVASDMGITFPVGNIVKTNFSLAGASFTVEEHGVAGAVVPVRVSPCVNFTPYVGKDMRFTYGGVSYVIDALDLNVSSEVYDTEGLTTTGITKKTTTSKSTVGGSFGLEYSGTTLFSRFKAGTSGALWGLVRNATTTAGIYAPRVVLSEPSKTVDSGIYKESLTYTCLSSEICSSTSEDALTIFFE